MNSMDNKFPGESSSLEVFELDYLKQITGEFSKENIIGQGGFGVVYKGEHKGELIAVKRLYNYVGLDDENFHNECINPMGVSHSNIVGLVGYCHVTHKKHHETDDGKNILAEVWERLLCFEFFPHGSLDRHLSDESCRFDWHTCYITIKGICEGIKYLHGRKIWHLDLKPANILVAEDMTPKIGDFGLSKLTESKETCIIEHVIGTRKYMPKECIDDKIISEKSDIFSLGVVIIDILAGPMGYNKRYGMSREDIIVHVLQNWRERVQDTKLLCIKKCIEIALRCVQGEWKKRPTITKIVDELDNIHTDSDETPQILKMHPMAPASSSHVALKQQAAPFHGDPIHGVPVYVMLPLDTVGLDGELTWMQKLWTDLEVLKNVGVAGVVVDVWWGVVERKGPKQYDWKAYVLLVEMVKRAGLRLKMVLSFHQCKISDSFIIPLPPWVVEEMKANPDMMYTDAKGNTNRDYISLGCDTEPVLRGRTPMQVYANYMRRLRDEFHRYLGRVIVEIQVGMGPDGQLMYPSYSSANGWHFPGIGEFQCHDNHMYKSLKKAAAAREKLKWARARRLIGAGTYNNFPEDTTFFRKDGQWKDQYGRFFLSWYSRKLLKHGDHLLAAAAYVFGPSSGVTLSAKVSGIHWHYATSSHAAELTAGYYNTRHRDGYLPIMQMLRKHGAVLNFSCVQMRDYEQPPQASSSPEILVKKVGEAARKANVQLIGENALPRYDEYAFSQVVNTAVSEGMSAFTYQRMNPELFQVDNWRRFVAFIKAISEISAKAP